MVCFGQRTAGKRQGRGLWAGGRGGEPKKRKKRVPIFNPKKPGGLPHGGRGGGPRGGGTIRGGGGGRGLGGGAAPGGTL